MKTYETFNTMHNQPMIKTDDASWLRIASYQLINTNCAFLAKGAHCIRKESMGYT